MDEPWDFLFPQRGADLPHYESWLPRYTDYLYLAFTTSFAFSPTDTLPLTRRAKLLMLLQSTISIITLTGIAASAIGCWRGANERSLSFDGVDRRVIDPHHKTHPLRRTQPLHPDPVLAAQLQSRLAVRGRHRRVDAVGPGRAGGDGLCRRRRSAAAGGPLHPARRAVGVRAARHLAPPRGPGHLGDGRAARLVGYGGARHPGAGRRRRDPDPALYQAYASAFVLVVGVVFLLAGVARLGFITQFLSKPVMDGFVTGLALFVAVGQLNKLFGVPKGEGNTVEKLIAIVHELPQANWITFAVGAGALALLFLLPRWNRKIPAGLIVLFGYIALSTVLGLNANYGVEVVGSLPQGLPKLTLPLVPFTAYLAMIAPAIGVLLVAYSEALGVAREFGEKHGYEVDPNQELNAHAVANLASSLFGGMIAAGSMSASAVKKGTRRAVAGGEPGHVGHGGRDGAVPHAAVPESARSGAGGVDHPRGVAHHRLAQTPARAPDLADGVLAGGDHVRRRDPP